MIISIDQLIDEPLKTKEIIMQYTTAAIAEKFGTDSRTLRKFLRSESGMNSKVGKGKRWAIEGKEIAPLRSKFEAWNSARNANSDEESAES